MLQNLKLNIPAAIAFAALACIILAAMRYVPEAKEVIALVGAALAALTPALISREPPEPPADNGPKPPLSLVP